MPVLFRTVYACGLRVSEARLLAPASRHQSGVLQIRDAKGGKDRQVPPQARCANGWPAPAHMAGQPGWEWFFPGASAGP